MQNIRYDSFSSYQRIENSYPRTHWKEEFCGEPRSIDLNEFGKNKFCYLSIRSISISHSWIIWIRMALGIAMYTLSLNGRLFNFDRDLLKTKVTYYCVIRETGDNVLALGTEQQKQDFFQREFNSHSYQEFTELHFNHLRCLSYIDYKDRENKRKEAVENWRPENFHEILNYKNPYLFLHGNEIKAKAEFLLSQHSTIESLLEAGLNAECFSRFFEKDDPRILELVLDYLLKKIAEDNFDEQTLIESRVIQLNILPLEAKECLKEFGLNRDRVLQEHVPSDQVLRPEVIIQDFANRMKALKEEYLVKLNEMSDAGFTASGIIEELSIRHDKACQDIEDFPRKDDVIAELNKQKEALVNQYGVMPIAPKPEDCKKNGAIDFNLWSKLYSKWSVEQAKKTQENTCKIEEAVVPLVTRIAELQRMTDTKSAQEVKEKYGPIVLEYRARLAALTTERDEILTTLKLEIETATKKQEMVNEETLNELKEKFSHDIHAIKEQILLKKNYSFTN